MEKEKEQSRFIIQRFDNYISSVNTKGNFLLAFNTFLCGGIISNRKNVIELIECPTHYFLVDYCLAAMFVIGLLTIVMIIQSVYPFLASGNSSINKYHSHTFFNSVAEFKNANDFYQSYTGQEDKEVEEDLAKQAFQLAQALKKKFYFLEMAMRLVYAQLVLLVGLLLIIKIY